MTTTDLSQSPVIAKPLSPAKQQELRHELAWMAAQSGVTDEQAFAQLAQDVSRFHGFMTRFLSPDAAHPFTHRLAADAHRASHGSVGSALPEGSDGPWDQSAQSILLNRRDDTLAIEQLLRDGRFVRDSWQQIAQGKITGMPEIGPLSADKQQELLETLLMPRGAGKTEPAAHIHMTARGHRSGHKALAEAFAPTGQAAALLRHEAAKALEGIAPARVQLIADHWMRVRSVRAAQVTDALAEGGEIVQQAIAQSEATRQKSGTAVVLQNEASLPSDSGWSLSGWLQNIISSGPRSRSEQIASEPSSEIRRS